jgi:endonuclease/exonuclease/phosphatase family metal-dependent hydrolase
VSALRVATYNLYLGADLARLFDATDPADLADRVAELRDQLAATRSEERARAFAGVLARESPDLVGLQEVSRWTSGAAGAEEQVLVDTLPVLLAELDRLGCPYDAHAVAPAFGGSLPVSQTRVMRLSGATAVLVRRGGPVVVRAERSGTFAARLEVRTPVPGVVFPVVRGWSAVDLRLRGDGRSLRFLTTHTEAYDAGVRDAQRDELLALEAGAGDVPVVLVGDLNARPEEVGLPPGWTDAWDAGTGPGHTCGRSADLLDGAGALGERIDYVWLRGVGVRAARVVGDAPGDRTGPPRLWPSDHAGVVADLAL